MSSHLADVKRFKTWFKKKVYDSENHKDYTEQLLAKYGKMELEFDNYEKTYEIDLSEPAVHRWDNTYFMTEEEKQKAPKIEKIERKTMIDLEKAKRISLEEIQARMANQV
jgi:hypothetical protein